MLYSREPLKPLPYDEVAGQQRMGLLSSEKVKWLAMVA